MRLRLNLILAVFVFAGACRAANADQPRKLSYSENRVGAASFDYQGSWIITGVAAESDACSLARVVRHRLLGASLVVRGQQVHFRRAPFSTPVLGEVAYDSHSREFWLDFRTDPQTLHLPQHVSAANLEIGTILFAGENRYFFDYSGVWFTLERTSAGVPSSH